MVSVDGLTVEFGGTTLFSDVSFVINEKDRIALMVGIQFCTTLWNAFLNMYLLLHDRAWSSLVHAGSL